MPGRNKLSLSRFKVIKILIDSGETYKAIADYMDTSESTIALIKKSENYEDYCNSVMLKSKKVAAIKAKEKEKNDKPQEQSVVSHQSVTVQATYFMTKELQEIKELLKGISAKLAFVVSELTGTPNLEERKDGYSAH